MYILIMLGLYLAQNSSRYMPNVLLNVDPKTNKIGFIVESKIHLQNPSFNKTSEKKLLIFQPMRGRLIEELSCDWLNDDNFSVIYFLNFDLNLALYNVYFC